jgi:hypothetical protein
MRAFCWVHSARISHENLEIEGLAMHENMFNRSRMEHKIGSLERTQGDHELRRLVPFLSNPDLQYACQLIQDFETEEISCETLDFELDRIFDRYREVKLNLVETPAS